MIVQIVEFLFYILLVYIAHVQTMTTLRYGDWFLSTPTMLFTMAVYFLYSSPTPPASAEEVWRAHRREIIAIWLANFGMLAFGLAGELGYLSKPVSFSLGTLCFAISFGILYTNFAKESRALPLFYVMTSVWSLYGIAFLQSSNTKNIVYNGLDILAKNFFGLYLAYIVWNRYGRSEQTQEV
jgi:bacteriorhodopsin